MSTFLPALFVAALLAGAPPASAGTVSYDRYVSSETDDTGGGVTEFHFVSVKAGPGERNDITAEAAGATVTIHDLGAPLRAGRMCSAVGPSSVRCTIEAKAKDPMQDNVDFDRNVSVGVQAGDGDDRLRIGTIAPRRGVLGLTGSVTLDGGAGSDELTGASRTLPDSPTLDGGADRDLVTGGAGKEALYGGTGIDTLRGGPGDDFLDGEAYNTDPDPPVEADTIDGGSGRDLVSYTSRNAPVRVDLGAGGPAGAVGENDTLSNVEDVDGGRDDNVLIGDDGPNRLSGSGVIEGSLDRLEGRGGDDVLRGNDGPNELLGGDGDDEFLDASRLLSCGAGDDLVNPTPRAPTAGSLQGCERLLVDYDVTARFAPVRVTARSVTIALRLKPGAPTRRARVSLRRLGSKVVLGAANVSLRGGPISVRIALGAAGRRALAGGRAVPVTVAYDGLTSTAKARFAATLRAG